MFLATGGHRRHYLTNPKVISTVDIIGELREGVSRKIDNTIYLVSSSSPDLLLGLGGYEA